MTGKQKFLIFLPEFQIFHFWSIKNVFVVEDLDYRPLVAVWSLQHAVWHHIPADPLLWLPSKVEVIRDVGLLIQGLEPDHTQAGNKN